VDDRAYDRLNNDLYFRSFALAFAKLCRCKGGPASTTSPTCKGASQWTWTWPVITRLGLVRAHR